MRVESCVAAAPAASSARRARKPAALAAAETDAEADSRSSAASDVSEASEASTAAGEEKGGLAGDGDEFDMEEAEDASEPGEDEDEVLADVRVARAVEGDDVVGDGDALVVRASKTTAILDWDDTICPSTHLSQLGMRVDDAGDLPAPLREQLAQLETAVINIMREALRFGNVVVITNAEAGWVELSGRRFLPDVVDFIRVHDIKIVSARTTFERDFPDAPSSWKVAAFSQEVTHMFPDEDELNVLVLGDSMSERDAAHALGSRMPNSKVKTVKFVERPSIDQLMRQVQLVAQSLPDLASYSSSFDVDLVVSASA